jgi:hypothetical protein
MSPTMRISLALWALAFVSCGSPSSEQPPPSSPSPSEPAPASDPTPASAVEVELHEWGLVDHALATGAVELATGPGEPARPMPMRKPVIYAHLADGVDRAELSVAATVAGGQVLEHWPAPVIEGPTVRWPHVVVTRGACAGHDDPSAVAREASQRDALSYCRAPDGFCEVRELATYRTTDHDCLEVGGAVASLLFYRATASPEGLPITATLGADGALVITARRSMSGAPGALLRIREASDGVYLARTGPPGVGQSVTLASPTEPLRAADERAALDRDLRALGMTASESEAFLRAWASELLAGPSASGRRAARWSGPRDILLYWLPEDAVTALSALAIEPATVRVRRAFLVRVDLTGR